MKGIDIGFGVSEACLQSCVTGDMASFDWIELRIHALDEHVFCDENGGHLDVSQWHLDIERARESHHLDDGSVGTLSYTSQGGLCKARVQMGSSQFDRLFQALASGRRIHYLMLTVRGLTESGPSLIWRRAGEVDLPIQMAGIRTVLFDMKSVRN